MSDLLNQASLVYIPSGYKEDTAYSVIPTDGSGDLTFTRASDGTRVNSQGLVERVPWNLLLQSNTFNTNWTAILGASISGGKSGYDGSNDAWEFTKASGQSSRIYQDITLSQTLHTTSIYAKAGTLRYLAMLEFSGAFVYFDLQNGTSNTVSGSPIDVNIEAVGATGWYRCSITDDNDITQLRIYASDTNGSISGAGTIFLQDAQVNEGSTAKPYFPTTDRQNVPRLDYSNGCPSLLLEPQRTNLATYSEQFDASSSWSLSRTSAFGSGSVVNSTTSPDGTQNAEYIQQATGQTDGGGCFQGISYTSGTTYTLSVFAKKGENRYARIGFGIGSGGAGIFCGFDLQDGISGTPDSGITPNIENYGNGWFRCSITATAQITAPRNTFIYQSSNLNTFVTTPLQGIYIWGAQLEAGSYPTSYIPTTSASVTRVADAAYKTGISSLIGQTEGTIFVEANLSDVIDPSNIRGILEINDGTTDNRISIYRGANDLTLNSLIFESALAQSIITASNISGRVKIGIAYSASDTALFINGTLIGTDTSSTIPACSDLDLGIITNRTDRILGDGINQAVLFKTRLTNAELASLTTL